MTDHSLFQDNLKAYADGELPWLRRLAVRRHLTHCASCREEISQMTQIAEDLHESETAEALDPALRAKILGIQEPALPQTATLPSEGRDRLGANANKPGLGSSGLGSRKRPALPWLLTGAALLAWFALFPTFQKSRDIMPSLSTASVPMAPQASAQKAVSAPQKPPTFTVRLSDREAGKDTNGYLSIKEPSSQYQDKVRVAGGGVPITVDVPQRQVHKEATIGVQVPNPEVTSDTVETMVKETGGYIAANTLSTGDNGLKTAELIVKVPVTGFEAFLSQVGKLGNVQSKNISGEDITEKTSDADQTEGVLEDDVQKSEARLKALGSKAKWHDEQATRDLRIQLAEARARLILLKRMAALSTITIDLSQTPKPTAPAPVTNGFVEGLKVNTHDALQSLLSSASALLALIIWLLAYAPLWVPLILVGRYGLREYRKRQG